MREKISAYMRKVKSVLFEQDEEEDEESLVEILYEKKLKKGAPQN